MKHPAFIAFAGAAACVLVAACSQKPQLSSAAPTATEAAACRVTEVGRHRLAVENGGELYVEPVAMGASGRHVLIAGVPNYMWIRDAAGKARFTARDSVFGVVVDAEGGARTIPAPISARLISEVRVLGRGDAAWDVVFAEVAPWTGYFSPDSAVRLWHGVYDGRRGWSGLEELPMPANTVVRPKLSSVLVGRDGKLAWALRSVGDAGFGLVVYERRAGRWSFESITPERVAAYPQLAYTDTAGLLLAVVGIDTVRPDAPNSLFLHARTSRWRRIGRVARGGEEPVHDPALSYWNGRAVMGWRTEVPDADGGTRNEARALLNALDTSAGKPIILDSSLAPGFSRPTPIITDSGQLLWTVDHGSPSAGNAAERRVLRILSASARGASVVWEMDTPFLGGFRSTSAGGSDLLLAGALVDQADSMVVSLLLRVRADCPESFQARLPDRGPAR
jgi:hypothetical protein